MPVSSARWYDLGPHITVSKEGTFLVVLRTTVILFGFTFGLLSASARATTYYLDSTSGNVRHGGTEITRALKTLYSGSANLYHPGDQILLKAGSIWKGERLQIATSGESGEPITIS
ncbi:MAG: hypothetical protein ACR2JB_06210 [Bryobacteraceae bacterium]